MGNNCRDASSGSAAVRPLVGGWLRRRARERLLRLSDPDAIDGLCSACIANDDPLLTEITIEGDHAPRDAQQRALFFFQL
jgi:hypothetical protein